MGLPAFHVVAIDLNVTDRLTKLRDDLPGLFASARCPHRKLGDFVVEVDEAFHDDAALAHAACGHGVVPSFAHVGWRADFALPLPEELIKGLTTQG